jgi:phosphohistidine phosphatase
MNRLYLVRHGIAVPHGAPEFPDDERPLTPKGERRVRQIAYGLKRLGPKIEKILTSPLPRAYRTAEIVARVLGKPDLLETADALHAQESADAIAGWLSTRTEESLMLVGHNPSLSDLIGKLVTGDAGNHLCELRKGGVAALVSRPDDPSRMTIEWIARPRLLRRMNDR